MKNIILIAIIILTFFISCRKSTLKITEPEPSFFLDKMKGGDYTNGDGKDSFKVSNDGKNITIGSNNYTFESDIMGIGGIYQDANSSNYVGVVPVGDSMYTVTMDKNEKDALNDIVKVVGKENSGPVIKDILTNNGKLDADSITKNFPDKKNEVENIIKKHKLDEKNKFGDYKEYKKT